MKMIFDKLPTDAVLRGKKVEVVKLNEYGTKCLIHYGPVKAWVDIFTVEPYKDGEERIADGQVY